MKVKLVHPAVIMVGLCVFITGNCYAQAHTSVITKTMQSETVVRTAPARMNGWGAVMIECTRADDVSICHEADIPAVRGPAAGNSPPRTSADDLEVTPQAVGTGLIVVSGDNVVSHLKIQDVTDTEQQPRVEMGEQPSIFEQFFQLSETFDWRIKLSELGGPNEVHFFASQRLSQNPFGPNSSVKLDANVNLETSTGSASGRASLIVAW